MYAKFERDWSTGQKREVVAVELQDRLGRDHQVRGPVNGPRLVTGTRPRPKKALHAKDVDQAVEICEAVGLSYWATTDQPRRYWAVDGSRYYLVHYVAQCSIIQVREVNAWGETPGWPTTHPAPAGL